MKTNITSWVAALGAAVLLATPALASADKVYFLVGVRHVYRIGPDAYIRVTDRSQIEQDYADRVAGDQETYSDHINTGADPAAESDLLNQDLAAAADERDQHLGDIYQPADYMREGHPELQIEGDGPYQVIGIDFHRDAQIMVFEDYCVYAPWPGYMVVDAPYGWAYGRVYDPFAFQQAYVTWHTTVFIGGGRPAFFGFVGHAGPLTVGISLNAGGHGFAIAHPGHVAGFRGGVPHAYGAAVRHTGSVHPPTDYGAHPGASGYGGHSGGTSGYGHPDSGRPTAGSGDTHKSTGGYGSRTGMGTHPKPNGSTSKTGTGKSTTTPPPAKKDPPPDKKG